MTPPQPKSTLFPYTTLFRSEISCKNLFDALDELEKRLSKSRYLFGKRIVEADWRLFCTLIRFDVVYHGHFKCKDRKSTRLNSSHVAISYAVFCLKKKNKNHQ